MVAAVGVGMMRRFLGAVQFLTVIPIRTATAPPGECGAFFPLVGLLIGGAAAGLWIAAHVWFSDALAALFPLLFLIAITGGLHEDGLADIADAIRANRSRERMHEIMKDSRVGAYGVLALVISLLFRWQAIAALRSPEGLAVACVLSRTTMVALAAISQPAGEGLGADFIRSATRGAALLAILQGGAAALLLVPWAACLLLGSQALVLLAARAWFHRRLGGVTGDCFGAAAVVGETLFLILLA